MPSKRSAILELADPIEHVEILNPFSLQDFAEDKLIVLDIRGRDSRGRWLNIEMQVSVFGGLIERLVYYACTLFTDQLQAGHDYSTLRPAISICLLCEKLFRNSPAAHHRFRLADPQHEQELSASVEIHTVELTKYNLDEKTISLATAIEQWAFFLLYAHRYDSDRPRDLLPDEGFQQAIEIAETIKAKTEDRLMYDQREKAQRDYRWAMEGARKEALEEGWKEGWKEGREEGREEGSIIGRIQLLEELLGEEHSTTESLLERPMTELISLLTKLQQALRSRTG